MNLKTRAMIRYLRRKIEWLFRKPLFPWRFTMHCKFEPTLQLECLKSAIELVRAGDFSTRNVADGIEHLSCFAGCAAAYVKTLLEQKPDDDLFPRPDGFKSVDYSTCTCEELCDDIENCIPKGGDTTAVDWTMVFNTLLPLVLALLQKLINR